MIKIKNYLNQSSNFIKRTKNYYKTAYLTEFGQILNNLPPKAKILDVGCGQGDFLKVVEGEFKDFILFGVELDKNTYLIAKKKVKRANIVNKDVFYFLKNYRDHFEAIFLIDVLEHIDNKKIPLLLKLIKKSLKKEGYLIVRTSNAESVLTGSYMRYIDLTHTISFTRESLRSLLEDNGFKKIEIRGQKFPSFWFSFLFKIPRFLIETFLKLILFFYYGEHAFNSIQTPNLIAIAQK